MAMLCRYMHSERNQMWGRAIVFTAHISSNLSTLFTWRWYVMMIAEVSIEIVSINYVTSQQQIFINPRTQWLASIHGSIAASEGIAARSLLKNVENFHNSKHILSTLGSPCDCVTSPDTAKIRLKNIQGQHGAFFPSSKASLIGWEFFTSMFVSCTVTMRAVYPFVNLRI